MVESIAVSLHRNQNKDKQFKNTVMKANNYFIEQVTNNGVTYFQEVRRRDGAILFSNQSLSLVADRLFKPTYKDGSPVIL